MTRAPRKLKPRVGNVACVRCDWFGRRRLKTRNVWPCPECGSPVIHSLHTPESYAALLASRPKREAAQTPAKPSGLTPPLPNPLHEHSHD